MNTDVHPSSQPAHTTRYLKNMVPLSVDGNMNAVENMDGNILTSVVYPDGFKVIGHVVLNTDIIVVLAHPSGYSQVGIVTDQNGFLYTPVAPVGLDDIVPEDNIELGFSYNKPVQCESRKLINGHRLLYYTDNSAPFGRVDLDNPPKVGTASKESALIPDMLMPRFSYEVVTGSSASFRPGKIQLITRYVTDSGGYTFFGIPSEPIDVYKGNSPNEVQGGYGEKYLNNNGDELEDPSVSKAYKFEITNIDTTYASIEIFVISYEGNNTNPVIKCRRVAEFNIPGIDKLTYTVTEVGNNESIEVGIDEIRQQPVSYNRAKTIAQKDNTLFLGGLSSADDTEILQEIANAVEVDYSIVEVPYSGREGGVQENTNTEAIVTDSRSLSLSFPERLTDDTGFPSPEFGTLSSAPLEVSRYELSYEKTPNLGSINVDLASVAIGETITINTSTSSLVFTFVDPLVVISTGYFEIRLTTEVNDVALELASKIINNPTDITLEALIDEATPTEVLVYTTDFENAAISTTSSLIVSNLTYANTPYSLQPTSLGSSETPFYLEFDDYIYAGGVLTFIENTYEPYQSGIAGVPIQGVKTHNIEVENSVNSLVDTTINSGVSEKTDYTSENVISSQRTYRRREVYSLSFCLLMNNGSTTPVFHIPGRISNIDPANLIAGTTNKYNSPDWGGGSGPLGTYVSNINYPIDSMFPGDFPGDDDTIPRDNRDILHHVMPGLSDEVHVRSDNSGNFFL